MSDAAQTFPSRTPPKQIERMAWAIVWLSFSMFCALCVGSSIAVYAYLFYSVAPLNVEAQVGKGTVVISSLDAGERGQRLRENLPVRPVEMSTDALSQATLVVDTGENDLTRFVAAITLKNNSSITLRRASRPRFDWSTGRYEIELSDLVGDIEVVVGDLGDRSVWIQITTARGEAIQLMKAGRYAITVSDLRVQLANRRGESVFSSADGSRHLLLRGEQDAVLIAGRPPVVSSLSRINLIDHGLFIFDAVNTADRTVPILDSMNIDTSASIAQASTLENRMKLPVRWGCANSQKDMPRGSYMVDELKGRTALHLVRADNATTNGETRCKQLYADPGLNVLGYNFLELETTFLIESQSISECGVEGSECPLMIHLEYTDTNGVAREWYQGFYSTLDPLYDSYKPRCASCTQDHQQINEKVWYTYESGNLLNILPEDARPASINTIEFYASGHRYNVYVGEVSLFAGLDSAVPPDGTAPIGTTP